MTEVPRKARKHSGQLQPMKVRPVAELLAIRKRYGSAAMAAMRGAVNAEEYLAMEKLSEH